MPGCFSAGDAQEEAFVMAKEAAAGWIEAAADYGQEIPKPSALDEIKNNPDYKGWLFGEIDIDSAY